MRTMARSIGEHALVVLTAAVEGHKAGGEVRTPLQSDWSDCAVLPTIIVRIGNHVTVKQARTYHEAAEALLAWVGRLVIDASSGAGANGAMYHASINDRAHAGRGLKIQVVPGDLEHHERSVGVESLGGD